MANLRNHFLIGVPIYTTAAYLFCCDNAYTAATTNNDGTNTTTTVNNLNENHRDDEALLMTPSDRLTSVASILFVQSVCFYTAHRAFHSNPQWYQHHRFHHRFNTHVPPMAANAVSPVEYIFAYILPFTLILPVLKVDTLSLRIVVSIVSVTNLMIHTPKLSAASERFMPEWLVSTEDHLEHHRKLNCKYAAPTFNVDYIVDWIEELYFRTEASSSSHQHQQQKREQQQQQQQQQQQTHHSGNTDKSLDPIGAGTKGAYNYDRVKGQYDIFSLEAKKQN
eukprot:CAMPEP_0113454358 /NCGR_PEP_ID=MMETSP0014_2-20120614/7822_1 /TAXON_ID=2857 /ORGANISM="Nitzschia sp." /LENGTH=278 /DNA_ID=CAMNT_0000345761 /DNA_START=736 /DNA_END=1572 /DNA_ORIENTATION=+ /assembly_acc=CAM_ASM_000159